MASRASILFTVGLGLLAAGAACTRNDDETVAGPDAVDSGRRDSSIDVQASSNNGDDASSADASIDAAGIADARIDDGGVSDARVVLPEPTDWSLYSFWRDGYSTACMQDDDCAVVKAPSLCTESCCSGFALARSEVARAEQEAAAVKAACVADRGGFFGCTQQQPKCFPTSLRCRAGTCRLETDPRYSFSAEGYSRICTKAEDCALAETLGACNQCCGTVPIATSEAQRAVQDLEAAKAACFADGLSLSQCTMACNNPPPACHDGKCVRGGGSPLPASCAPRTGGSSTPLPDLGASTSCGVQVVRTGFDDALDPTWRVNEPSAISIDRAAPLAGVASLRIAYAQTGAYLTIPQPNACALRLAFTLRTHVDSSELTLARINAVGNKWSTSLHVGLRGCTLNVAQTVSTSDAYIHGGGSGDVQSWTVPSETAVRVVMTVDTRMKRFTLVVAPVGEPFPAPRTTGFLDIPSVKGEGTINAIDLGAAPGAYGSSALGAVWIDDLVID